MTYTMGVYRALHHMGILQKMETISSVSGGTWASAVYMFAKAYNGQPIDTMALLGDKTDISQLTMAQLEQPPPPSLRGLASRSPVALFAKNVVLYDTNEFWPRAMADLFLDDFGLGNKDTYMACTEADVERIKRENPGLQNKQFLTPRADRPKCFVMNGTMLAPDNYLPDGDNVVSFQMSPDFTGSPFYPNATMAEYPPELSFFPAPLCCVKPCWRSAVMLVVGGGMVESFAFGGSAPKADQKGGKTQVGAPKKSFSLSEAVGISSFFPGAALGMSRIGQAYAGIQRTYWPVASETFPGPVSDIQYSLGDGGALDNSGLLALLQRKAERVIWIASSFQPLNDAYDFQTASQETFDPRGAGVIDQVFSAFGFGVNGDNFWYENNQVFKKKELLGVARKMAALKAAGKPIVVKETLEVLPNDYWGIIGGYSVSVVLIYLEEVRDFQSQLPQETQDELARGAQGPFRNFPIYETEGQLDLSPAQVNLLAAQGEYTVRQNAELFEELLAPSENLATLVSAEAVNGKPQSAL